MIIISLLIVIVALLGCMLHLRARIKVIERVVDGYHDIAFEKEVLVNKLKVLHTDIKLKTLLREEIREEINRIVGEW